jgi:hypothetical protein
VGCLPASRLIGRSRRSSAQHNQESCASARCRRVARWSWLRQPLRLAHSSLRLRRVVHSQRRVSDLAATLTVISTTTASRPRRRRLVPCAFAWLKPATDLIYRWLMLRFHGFDPVRQAVPRVLESGKGEESGRRGLSATERRRGVCSDRGDISAYGRGLAGGSVKLLVLANVGRAHPRE